MIVIVPGEAMSAGTVLALSADRIMMDYFSRLGPIDPQIFKDDKFIPALSYLKKYEELNQKAQNSQLTTVEYAMLQQLDLAEMYQFEQARELSIELLKKWLSKYKFKDWQRGDEPVAEEIKKQRAAEIASILSDSDKWHSHGRGISMETLRGELNLRIEDYSENGDLSQSIRDYVDLLLDYLNRHDMGSFVHTKAFF